MEGKGDGALGRRSPAQTTRGRHAADRVPRGRVTDLAMGGTLRAAAPYQVARARDAAEPRGSGDRPAGLRLVRGDLREKVREGREGNLVLFCVDASGSMAARRRMSAVKGAVLSLLLDAYQRRDRVGLVTFAGEEATVVLPPTPSTERATRLLADLRTGGRTPLAAGLERCAAVLAAERVRDPRRRPLLVLLTDGRATAAREGDPVAAAVRAAAGLGRRGVPAVVVDTEEGFPRLGIAGMVAAAMGAPVLALEDLGQLGGVVRLLTRAVA